jgi:hypothetical protein
VTGETEDVLTVVLVIVATFLMLTVLAVLTV